MTKDHRLRATLPRALVLRYLLGRRGQSYAGDIADNTGLARNTVRSILLALETAGYVSATWEAQQAVQSRPRRRYYRLAEDRRVEALELVAARRLS